VADSLRLRAEGVGWRAAWRLARALPEGIVVRGFERVSDRSYRRNAKRRAAIVEALAPVVGEERAPAAAREAFRWYGRYWAETFRMQDLSDAGFDARFRCTGQEHIANAFSAGRGAVLATPHFGNWDAGGRWVARQWPLTVVAEVLRPRSLFYRFVAHRESLGMTIVPLERGGDATAKCMKKLAQGELVALVSDRDMSGSGIEVSMFGRKTKLPPGPAVLSIRSGAPLIPATIYQHDDGSWEAWVLPPLAPKDDVAALTQDLARGFQTLIERAPEQWHMFSRYWIDEAR
jgi:lauroyl/myristoyl acyltransferase